MKPVSRRFAALTAVAATFGFAARGRADEPKTHRVAFHVDQNDPKVMNLALNNVSNLLKHYQGQGEKVEIEVVAYGPGLNMLREDTSPVKGRIASMKSDTFNANLAFSACGNTKRGMEKAEGHPIEIISQAHVVPAGIVRLTELQEQGWTYIKP
jgi:intracellular sulfur oxidation DsrE/DsrF family protein